MRDVDKVVRSQRAVTCAPFSVGEARLPARNTSLISERGFCDNIQPAESRAHSRRLDVRTSENSKTRNYANYNLR